MQIRQLQCFLAVIRHGSFSAAADSLFLSQSTLSKQIISLEKELSCKLFVRKIRHHKMTLEGEHILPHAERIILEYERMLVKIKQDEMPLKTRFSLAVPYDVGNTKILELVIEYKRQHPEIYLELNECSYQEMAYNLEGHNADLAIGFQQFFPWQENLIAIPCCSSNLVVVVNKNHELANLPMITLELLKDTPILINREDHALMRLFQNLCSMQNFWPNMDESALRLSSIKQYLSNNLAVTFMTDLYANTCFPEPDFRIIPVDRAKPLTLAIFARNELHSNVCKTFIEHMKSTADIFCRMLGERHAGQ